MHDDNEYDDDDGLCYGDLKKHLLNQHKFQFTKRAECAVQVLQKEYESHHECVHFGFLFRFKFCCNPFFSSLIYSMGAHIIMGTKSVSGIEPPMRNNWIK